MINFHDQMLYKYGLIVIMALHCLNVKSQNKNISFHGNTSKHPTIQFAVQELEEHLNIGPKNTNHNRFRFEFKINGRPENGTFSYAIHHADNTTHVLFTGADETSMLHAVHAFLEHLGFQFEFNGTIRPKYFRADTLTTGNYTTVPFSRWRGIRQHVNFPMDISSYPIDEAKAYVKNLIRMKFNVLAIHSYPNLWHEVQTGDSIEYAGNFFYNRVHEIPEVPVIKKNIRFNKKYFVIPEIEPYYNNRIKKSEMAVDWMSALLIYAKSIGLRIQFSIEPRKRGEISYILDNCRSALKNYPMIDALEIITEELGGWGNSCTDSTVKSILVAQFGESVLKDTVVTNVIKKNQTDLDNLILQVGRNIAALKMLKKEAPFASKKIDLKLGVYCTIQPYAAVAYHLVRKYLPDAEVTIMPGHGSVRTARHFSGINANAADMKKTTIFSWIEFDGLMFTQQNPIAGIESLINNLAERNKGQQTNAIIFNHWRTAENRTAAKYAALSSLHGPISSNAFYLSHAKGLGIKDVQQFVHVMKKLETIDLIATNDLPNVGFCWVGAWLQGGPYTWMNRAMLDQVRNMYDSVGETLEKIRQTVTTKAGQDYIEFLYNRVNTSVRYLKAFSVGAQIQEIQKDSAGTYSMMNAGKATYICNRALSLFEEYMQLHTTMMPDRGSEGTLINLWHGPMYGLKVLRQKIGGIPMDAPFKEEKSTDAPPLPILFKPSKGS